MSLQLSFDVCTTAPLSSLGEVLCRQRHMTPEQLSQSTLEDVGSQPLQTTLEDTHLYLFLPTIEDVRSQSLQLTLDACATTLMSSLGEMTVSYDA